MNYAFAILNTRIGKISLLTLWGFILKEYVLNIFFYDSSLNDFVNHCFSMMEDKIYMESLYHLFCYMLVGLVSLLLLGASLFIVFVLFYETISEFKNNLKK